MRKIVTFIVCALTLTISSFVWAELLHPLGVGVVIGTTTGFTAKYIENRKIAYDGELGWGDGDNYRLSGDMLWQKPHLFIADNKPFDGYLGVGARLRDRGQYSSNSNNNGVEFGPRGVGGIRYMFHNPRVEVYSEVALVMDIIPSTDADLEIGIGGRYYF